MLKKIITTLIRYKNPDFSFDSRVSEVVLISLLGIKLIALLRANFKLLLHFKAPSILFAGKGVKFFNASAMKFGRFLYLGDYVYLSALGIEGLTIGDNSSIGAYSRLVVSTSFNNIGRYIRIGKNVGIGEFAYLGGGGGLDIGNDCIIGQYLSCHPENHRFEVSSVLIRCQGTVRKGISIGNNCWIGAKVTLLDGAAVGNNCVIAAGAVVNKKFPDNCIIGGVPARIIRQMGATGEQEGPVQLPVNSGLFQ